MSNQDDTLPADYPYSWKKGSDMPLKDFLAKYKPSMIQDDGTKPWIWVSKTEPKLYTDHADEAEEEASKICKTLVYASPHTLAYIYILQNDDSIPIRSNKKKGTKSKKELREALQWEAIREFRLISVTHSYRHGKWLIFAPSEKVDHIWATIASLDSKHPSGIQSTIWKNFALMKDSEIKELKEKYFAELETSKAAAKIEKASEKPETSGASSTARNKTKLKPKKKAAADPFASDDEAKAAQPDKEASSENEDEADRKAALQAKKKAATTKRAASKRRKSDDDDDEEEVKRPKKRGGKK
ncbi:hypothetical protein EIP86_011143 [Pleurotus ostreatoroseus]|nr:hypothetical protein EIP86_011143 [Pleurotus ostreatoroseus]